MREEVEMRDSWHEVQRLREDAERYARLGDTLAAALQDTRASQMAERLRAAESAREEGR